MLRFSTLLMFYVTFYVRKKNEINCFHKGCFLKVLFCPVDRAVGIDSSSRELKLQCQMIFRCYMMSCSTVLFTLINFQNVFHDRPLGSNSLALSVILLNDIVCPIRNQTTKT